MSDTPWQYWDATDQVVFRVNPDGGMESHLATTALVQEWIAAGNTPLAAPAPSGPSQPTLAQLQEQLAALSAQITALQGSGS